MARRRRGREATSCSPCWASSATGSTNRGAVGRSIFRSGAHCVDLVRRMLVKNDMHVAVGGKLTLDGVEEGDEFQVPVALHVLPDHRALESIQGRELGGGAIALVVVGPGCRMPFSSSEAAPGCAPAPGSATSRPLTARSHVPAGSRKARQCRAACPRMPDRSRP